MDNNMEPFKAENYENGKVKYDHLYKVAVDEGKTCGRKPCTGAVMRPYVRCGTTPRPKDELLQQAKKFFDEYYTSIKRYNLEPHNERWRQVVQEVQETGTYELKETELAYGAKLAWRNAPRCIGRMQWAKLQVFDARYVSFAGQMFDALCNHMKYATNKGNIRSAITVFPHRTDGKHDFRVWNAQLLMYAGYRQLDGSVIGDPINAEFTELCQRLGWKGKGGSWDVLPLVLSANGKDPELFEIPDELIMRVKIEHPECSQFDDLQLQWFCVPAVSDMLFDIGGLEFTAAPFNGWYMGTEIGTRDLCDQNRINILKDAAIKLGINTTSPVSLWKDRALVEVNRAVLHSFQQNNVTIMDHHTTTEIFMRHFENEHRVRGGCPADWVWLVPPMSGSITPVFHQEMVCYHLKPAYEYQEKAWKTHVWHSENPEKSKRRKKLTFRELARAVNFASFLYKNAMSQRIKVTILYASETGRSEKFARMLKDVFNHAFNTNVQCMADYDVVHLEHEALVLYVTSTFGNGDAPENGEEFGKHLLAMKISGEVVPGQHALKEKKVNMIQRALSATTPTKGSAELTFPSSATIESMNHAAAIGALANVRYAVFALGSSAYPNFCAFGKYIHNLMNELGSECIEPLAVGDELCSQEAAFFTWAKQVFKSACDTFCVGDNLNSDIVTENLQKDDSNQNKYRLSKSTTEVQQLAAMQKFWKKPIFEAKLISNEYLCQDEKAGRETILVKLDTTAREEGACNYQPGDHLSIYPENEKEKVDKLLSMLGDGLDCDQVLSLQEQIKTRSMAGVKRTWMDTKRLPRCSLRDAFTYYLDINVPPSIQLMNILQETATDEADKNRLLQLTTDLHLYDAWKHDDNPGIVDVLETFRSVQPDPTILVRHLPLVQPRYYSISSCPQVHEQQVHLTVAIVKYKNKHEAPRKGLCSNYLLNLKKNDKVRCFHRKASRFHMPELSRTPLIMIGPGTGIAPFRGFWHHRLRQKQLGCKELGEMYLYFGCRTSATYLYKEELQQMIKETVINNVYTAYSREKNVPKQYVQDLITKDETMLFNLIYKQGCHIYVCGDVSMAEEVGDVIRDVINNLGHDQKDIHSFSQMFFDERYHEDIFGITLRTAEVTKKGRLEATKSKEKTSSVDTDN